MLKKALIVGIDNYPFKSLNGCINDAKSIATILAEHENGRHNFTCNTMLSTKEKITKASLNKALEELLFDDIDAALFYFAGHGLNKKTGGYLITQDGQNYDEGIELNHIIRLANLSQIQEITILLDCCHAGGIGNTPFAQNEIVQLRKGVAIITATTSYQFAIEEKGNGLFSQMVVAALSGEAANLLGAVTISDIYAYVSTLFGPWKQRPIFKSFLTKTTPLRWCTPKISIKALKKITTYFPYENYLYPLNPTYEHTSDNALEENVFILRALQRFHYQGLLQPVEEDYMFDAVMKCGKCALTSKGKYYWKAVKLNRI